MLFFTKKKAILAELTEGLVDIHSHLIPGIDDGSKSSDQSMLLIGSLKKIGFTEFIATPHIIKTVWDNSPETILPAQKILNDALSNIGHDFQVRAAAEYMMDDSFLNLLDTNTPLLTLKDNYVLVEMSYINPPIQLHDIIFKLRLAGYQPVLAHPERYLFYHNNISEYKRLKQSGCLFQLNLLSTVGYYGEKIAKVSEQLLASGLYDFVGSDVHHENHVKSFQRRITFKDAQSLKDLVRNNNQFSSH
ncbi:histidinol phosphatase [Flavobacterium sp. NST-5]|uniref:protein-tyrosine-phosphatase n=1 Tax=Flavobacterium ichthyis TaxID=2698827 RepID=A0ABW9Z880_9FLAO|nr:CpsB/CapC family capsule biosynthesis tyrosine phosphatase [Flavobacterium ichthyis]NBL64829.1 histidinol phosphatase [Flavobacterium ichthyis]